MTEWTRRPPGPRLDKVVARRPDLRFVVRRTWELQPAIVFGVLLAAKFSTLDPSQFSSNAVLYYRATVAWIAGGDPWAVTYLGTRFAAPPPVLLLNVPLVPFGEAAAMVFWPAAGFVGMVLAVRHYRLPWWWLAFPPFIEGLVPGSPDLALLGAVILGGGALAAFTKPYAIPGMGAEGRWRAIAVAAALGLVTLPLLPWDQFLGQIDEVAESLAGQLHAQTLPLAGTIVVAVAVVSLGRIGLSVAVPALLPAVQPHYASFSVWGARQSVLLALGLAIPNAAPAAVVAYACGIHVQRAASVLRARSATRRSRLDGDGLELGDNAVAEAAVDPGRTRRSVPRA